MNCVHVHGLHSISSNCVGAPRNLAACDCARTIPTPAVLPISFPHPDSTASLILTMPDILLAPSYPTLQCRLTVAWAARMPIYTVNQLAPSHVPCLPAPPPVSPERSRKRGPPSSGGLGPLRGLAVIRFRWSVGAAATARGSRGSNRGERNIHLQVRVRSV